MAQKKAHEVDAWLARPDPRIRIVLIYGPDRGLVSERARVLAAKTGIPLEDPFGVVRLDAAEVEQSPGRLLDEARIMPMFAKERLIWLRGGGGQKSLAESIQILVAEPPQDTLILVEAGDLKKNAALRIAVEGGAQSMALPCYADDGRGIDSVIDDELGRAGLSISLDARQALRTVLGGDRLATRGELQKLALFARGRGQISLDDVRSSVGDVASISSDDAIDAVLAGNTAALDQVVTRMTASGSAPAALLGAAVRQFHALQLMRQMLDSGGRNAPAIVAAARPPIFFSRRKSVEVAVQTWPSDAIARTLERLHAAMLETRRRPELLKALTRQTLLAVTIEGARHQRSR